MARVIVARHLHRFFPVLKDGPVEVAGTTAAEVIRAIDAIAPGFSEYVVDERGALRMHVNVFVGEEPVLDRRGLTDRVPHDGTVYVLQALSGG